MAEDARPPLGDPMLERLERLAERQRRTQPGQPLPPPTSPDGAAGPIGGRRLPATDRSRRRHPSRGARVGALIASCASTGGLALYFAGTNSSSANGAISGLAAPVSTTPTPATTSVSPTTASASKAGTTATTTRPTTATTAARSAAAFDGDKVQTKYGPLQVQAQVKDGALVAVDVVEYPSEDGKSVRINQRALPTLQSEALAAQSAQVHSVSGATYTSTAYVKSLQSAIDDARAAGALKA